MSNLVLPVNYTGVIGVFYSIGYKFEIYDTDGLGNCFFDSVSCQLVEDGINITGLELRREVHELIEKEMKQAEIPLIPSILQHYGVEELERLSIADPHTYVEFWGILITSIYLQRTIIVHSRLDNLNQTTADLPISSAFRGEPIRILLHPGGCQEATDNQFMFNHYAWLKLVGEISQEGAELSPSQAIEELLQCAQMDSEASFYDVSKSSQKTQESLTHSQIEIVNPEEIILDSSQIQPILRGEKMSCPFSHTCSYREALSRCSLQKHLENDHRPHLYALPVVICNFLRRKYCMECKKLRGFKNTHLCMEEIRRLPIQVDLSTQSQDLLGITTPDEMLFQQTLEQFDWKCVNTIRPPSLRTVPSWIRASYFACLMKCLKSLLVNLECIAKWKEFLLLPIFLLSCHDEDLNVTVRRNVSNYLNGSKAALLAYLTPVDSSRIKQSNSIARANYFIENGRASKAINALLSSKFAPCSDRTFKLCSEKHPFEPEPEYALPQTLLLQHDEAMQSCVLECLHSFDSTTASGPSNFSVGHFTDVLQLDKSNSFLKMLSELVCFLANGQACRLVYDILSTSRLICLEKPKLLSDGLSDVRPIAISEILTRLVSKVLLKLTSLSARQFLSPFQFGISIPCGAEIIAHSVRYHFRLMNETHQEYVLLQLDLDNAFNRVHRHSILSVVREFFPTLFPWVQSVYGKHSSLLWNAIVISSQSGVKQGDPIGPLLFCLVLHVMILKLKTLLPEMVQLWFLDDANLIVKISDIPTIIGAMRSEEATSLGLHLNLKKCSIFHPDWNSLSQMPGVNLLTGTLCFQDFSLPLKTQTTVVGSILGNEDAQIDRIVGNMEHVFKEIQKLSDKHKEFYLVKASLGGLCRANHIYRTLPDCSYLCFRLQRFKNDVLRYFLGNMLPPESLLRSDLKPRLGGLGFRGSIYHSSAAFISSIYQCFPFLQNIFQNAQLETIASEIQDLIRFVKTKADLSLLPELPPLLEVKLPISLQSRLNLGIDCGILKQILDSSTDLRSRTLLLGCSTNFASAWIGSCPNKSNYLLSKEFEIFIRYWFGVPLFLNRELCRFCKDKSVDIFGDHLLCCKHNYPGPVHRHNRIRDTWIHFARIGKLGPVVEPLGYILNRQSRVADFAIPYENFGHEVLFDVTIWSSTYEGRVHRSAKQRGVTAKDASRAKLRSRKADSNQMIETCKGKLLLIPLAMEVLGGFSTESIRFLRRLAREWQLVTEVNASHAAMIMARKLSIELARCNSRSLLSQNVQLVEELDAVPDTDYSAISRGHLIMDDPENNGPVTPVSETLEPLDVLDIYS
jgi:hypothetical protein